MPKILKITAVNGKEKNVTMFNGLHVADIEHFKIDAMRYMRRFDDRKGLELEIMYEETPPCGGWEEEGC